MIPYIVMVGVPAALAFYVNQIHKKSVTTHNLVIDVFFFIWLTLLMFRSIEVGCDLTVYNLHFNNYARMSWIDIFEKVLQGSEFGYIAIAKILSYLTEDFQWVMICCACISVIPIWKLYRDEKYFGFLIVVLFINIAPFSMYFSGLRQAMAMAFVVPCYQYCKEKNIKKYLLMILIAWMFHKSAFILLLMYPIYHLRLKKQIHIFYLLPGIVLIYIFNMPIFKFLLLFVGDKYMERYADGITETGAYAVLLLLIVMLAYVFLIPDSKRLDDDTVGLRNLMALSVFLQTFSGVHSIAMRMNYYYLLFIPLLIPRIIVRGNSKYRILIKVSIICMVLFFTFYYFYKAYTGDDILNVYPYKSFL